MSTQNKAAPAPDTTKAVDAPVETKEAPVAEAPKVEAAAPIVDDKAKDAPIVEAADKGKEEAADKTKEKPIEVPEKYDLKLPEGSKLDQKAIEGVAEYAKAQKLTNEQAQAVLERDNAVATQYAETMTNQLKSMNETTWKDQLVADKDFGGTNFEASGRLAARGAEAFFGAEFTEELKAMNLNHHPKLFKGFVKIGRAMMDDKLVLGSDKPKTEKKSPADVLYGKTK